MIAVERRQFPRKRLERLGYIEIEPNNGGIVLNASGEGLCFHSIAPVEKNGPLRFSLLDHNCRIDACGQLIWADEMRKVGGVRFTSFSGDGRERINDWIAQPETVPNDGDSAESKLPVVRRLGTLGGPRFDEAGRENPPAMAGWGKPRLKLPGFSGGVITGFLLSACLGAGFMFSYVHRRELGKSLIHWGERLAASSEGQNSRSRAPVPIAESSLLGKDDAPTSPPSNVSLPPEAPAVPKDTTDLKPVEPDATPTVPDPEPSPAAIDMIHRSPSPVRQATSGGAPQPVAPSTASVLAASPPPSAASLVEQSGVKPTLELTNTASLPSFSAAPDSILTMYFDIGRFKDEHSAHNLSARVGELGLPATIAKRGHLWANAYQVLVGPYGDPQEEKRLEHSLVAHGFKPRPFERGSRAFVFVSPLLLHASMLPVGGITIRWESFVNDARVKFLQSGNLLATADARWLPGAKKYGRDEYVYVKNGDGSRTLFEIHFSGLNRALVFHD